MDTRDIATLTRYERYTLDVQGYLVRRRVLGRRELTRLHLAIDALGVRPGSTVASQRFAGHLTTDEAFRSLMDHGAVFDVVRELCGSAVRLDHAYGIVMAPGTSGLGLHGGGAPFDPAQFYVTDADGVHTGLVAALWSLTHSSAGEGGFVCVPGSHKATFAMPPEVGWDGPGAELLREVPLGAGDLLLFPEALTHGTLTWRGRVERRLLAFKYSPGNSGWASELHAPAELVAVLSGRQRQLVEPPYVARRRPT